MSSYVDCRCTVCFPRFLGRSWGWQAGVLALPPSLPAAPIPAVLKPHMGEGFEVSIVARNLTDFTLSSVESCFL